MIRDIARLHDINVILGLDDSKKVHICPLPQHVHSQRPTPSLAVRVYEDGVQRFKCFGTCGLSGDAVDAIGYTRVPNYDKENGEQVKMAAALLSQEFEPLNEPVRRIERPTLDPLLWRDFYPCGDRVREYAKTRGLNPQTLEKFKIGDKGGAMAIPCFRFEQLIGIKFRATWPNPTLRFWSQEGSTLGLFNHDSVAFTSDPVLVVKGEIPAMLLDQHGFKACCPTAGEGTWDMKDFKPLFAFSDRVVVVGDNDRDPETRTKMQERAAQRAQSLGAILRFPPAEFKDIDDWVLADKDALKVIARWLSSDIERGDA